MEIDNHASFHRGLVLGGAGINLFVASTDLALIATCQEVMQNLEATEGVSGAAPMQICLWDYEPDEQNIRFPKPALGQKIFYVVPAAHLAQLRASIPEAEGNILLKPLTRVVLRAFLGSATERREGGEVAHTGSNELGTLRANRDEMLQHLLHANLRLQEYDQQRTNFIARALHDFRAPLTALSGFCGLLTSGELGPLSAVQQEVLGRMQRSTNRISHMASAMFDLSAGPRLGRNPDLREADILEPILQAVHEIAPLAREKQIEVRTEGILPPPTPLYFEPSQIEQVLVNLLDNACKFVPKFGFIEVKAYPYFWERRYLRGTVPPGTHDRRTQRAQTPNSYRIDIKDNGPGVAPELIEHIFEEYTSYSGSQDRSGGGLGLAICRLIISRHHGHVWAEASAQGSVFSFVLPLRQAGARRESEE
ncbi:MAG: HAMP domain-containing sensor histidine kinase [Bryobacteraceae bacterium]